jgi:hypothetical protein
LVSLDLKFSAESNKTASFLGWECFLLDPWKKGRAGSDDTGSAGVGNWILRTEEDSLAGKSDGKITRATAHFSNDTFDFAGTQFASWTF